jgi:hypothetical protein
VTVAARAVTLASRAVTLGVTVAGRAVTLGVTVAIRDVTVVELVAKPEPTQRGSPREGARSEARAEQRLAAGGCKLRRPG